MSMSYARYLKSVQLGRRLESSEEVDHIDGDRTHDLLANLQILTKSENSKKAGTDPLSKARKESWYWFICLHCLSRFERKKTDSHLRRGGKATYCGKDCGGHAAEHRKENQQFGKIENTFEPKGLGEPWEEWSDPIPVWISHGSSVSKVRGRDRLTCKHCFKPFTAPAFEKRVYCCDGCARAHRGSNKPNRDVLTKALQQIKEGTLTWRALGDRYNVTDNAVRKWVRAITAKEKGI
jgi:hypothetical protein